MRTRILTAIACGAAALTFSMPGSTQPASDATDAKPLVQWSGPRSKVTRVAYLRVTSEKDWRTLWQRHTGKPVEERIGGLQMPRVDFDRCMVIGVFLGVTTNSDGVVGRLHEEKDRVVFRYGRLAYQSGMNPPKVTPYGLFVVPRSKKPLVLQEDARRLKREDPVWVERARFEAITP